MAKVTMPQLGESVAEGTIGKWLKKPGDRVAKYEPLLEVITDKVNAEVPSPYEGVLKEILVEEGATVPNNAEIAIIETPEEAAAGGAAPSAEGAAPPTPSPAASTSAAPGAPSTATTAPAAPPPPPEGAATAAMAAPAPSTSAAATATSAEAAAPSGPGRADARMTPAVRRLLREHGIEPTEIVGTGLGGRITREDVLAYVEARRTGAAPVTPAAAPTTTPAPAAAPAPAPAAPSAPAAPPPAAPAPAPAAPPSAARGVTTPQITFPEGADEVLVPLTQMRKGIAAQMTRALAVPHAYVAVEVDATNLVRLREAVKTEYQRREGISLSYVPFVVKAAVEALRRHPTFNAHWTEAGLVAKRAINIGVAVAVEDGLIVPVVRDVDRLSIHGINAAIADVAARARAGKLRVSDFGGSTFTVDNTGWFGSNLTMPIINVPEVAILTMEQIKKRPVVVETPEGDVIAIRPVMNMVLGIDHRATDGAQAGAFLADVKAWLEAVGPETPIW